MCFENGVYFLRDQFFLDFPDPYLKGNHSGRRPHYYAFRDNATGLLWMIPLSKQHGKLADYVRRTAGGRICDVYHLTALGGVSGVLLIADMFPIIEDYIREPYTMEGQPVVFKDKSDIRAIDVKVRKVMAMLRRGVKFTKTQPDVFKIERELLTRRG